MEVMTYGLKKIKHIQECGCPVCCLDMKHSITESMFENTGLCDNCLLTPAVLFACIGYKNYDLF